MSTSDTSLALLTRLKQLRVVKAKQTLKSKSDQVISTSNICSIGNPLSPGSKKLVYSVDYVAQVKSLMEKKRTTNNNNDEDNSTIFIFNPPDWRWQKNKATELGLPIEQILWNKQSPWHLFTVDTPPKACQPVSGDGNCLFRAFSYWITGSENYHMNIREAIIREFKENESKYKHLLTGPSVENYLEESGMEQEGVWGTEAEVFVTATLLKTPVMVYASYGELYLWQKFWPHRTNPPTTDQLRRYQHERRKASFTPLATESTVSLYLHNSNNHFEPVVNV